MLAECELTEKDNCIANLFAIVFNAIVLLFAIVSLVDARLQRSKRRDVLGSPPAMSISSWLRVLVALDLCLALISKLCYSLYFYWEISEQCFSGQTFQPTDGCFLALWLNEAILSLSRQSVFAIASMLFLFFNWMADLTHNNHSSLRTLFLDWAACTGVVALLYTLLLTLYPLPSLQAAMNLALIVLQLLLTIVAVGAFLYTGGLFLLRVVRKNSLDPQNRATRFTLRLAVVYLVGVTFAILYGVTAYLLEAESTQKRSPGFILYLGSLAQFLPDLLILFSIADYRTSVLWSCCRSVAARLPIRHTEHISFDPNLSSESSSDEESQLALLRRPTAVDSDLRFSR